LTRLVEPDIAYHCNYSDPDCNETFFARQVVAGTSTRLYVVNAEESFDLVAKLDSIVGDFDELSIGSVVLPLDDLLGQVKRRHKVVLTGTGGDELFGGYVRYQLATGSCFQNSYRALYESMAGLPTVADRFELCHRKGQTDYYRFFDSDVRSTFSKAYEAGRIGDDRDAMLTFDRRYFLGGLLNIDDKMAGRHSVESRPSFLNQRFVRHVNTMAPSAFMQTDELKTALREIAAPIVPRAVCHRTDKMGFTTPIGTFVQQSSHLIREHLSRSPFQELYDLTRLKLTVHDKFSRHLFGLLMLDLWLNRYGT
jgi:asparagine synthase (glutamine-hydrolysing)